MGTVTVVWSVVAGSGLSVAVMQALVWWRRRDVTAHAFLAAAALGAGAMALCELWMMKAPSPASYMNAVRWAHLPVAVMVVSLVAYVWVRLGTGRVWLGAGVVGLRLVDLGLNVVLEAGSRFQEAPSLQPVALLGDVIVLPEAAPTLWMVPGQLSTVLFVVFLVDAAATAWRRRAPRRDVVMACVVVAPAALGVGQATLIFWGGLPTPVTLSMFFLPVLLAMAFDLSLDVVRTAALSSSLEESEVRLRLAARAGGVGTWIWHPDDDRIEGSSDWYRLFGLEEGSTVRGRDLVGRIHPDDRERARRAWARGLEGSGDFALEFRITPPGGSERWVSCRGRMFPDHAGGRELFGAAQDVTERKRLEEELRTALQNAEAVKDQLLLDNLALRDAVEGRREESRAIVGESEPILRMLALAERVAATDSVVLITGETGTGKELLAQAIHDMSARSARAMVRVNCAALPATLIESELFGREKGAYTGAMTRQAGRFELADHSTIFLDEIGELPLEVQAKLLRVLEDGHFERLGSTRTLETDARVIAATNRDLAARVVDGGFREDLYHRLNVFPIQVPALRDRPEDIPLLVWTFVGEFNQKMGKAVDQISRATLEELSCHAWPGNVRELRNLVERAMIMTEGRSLAVARTPSKNGDRANGAVLTLEEVEERHILKVLDRTGWKISGTEGAAEMLGIPSTTLHSRMKKLGIRRPARIP